MRRSKTPYIHVGIDPGITGAIGVLNHPDYDYTAAVFRMPTQRKPDGKKGKIVSGDGLRLLLLQASSDLMHAAPPFRLIVFLEDNHAMPKQGLSSTFSFGKTSGIIEGVLMAMGVRYYTVSPQHWKKRAGLLKTEKEASVELANGLFGLELSNHNQADALLIARFGA